MTPARPPHQRTAIIGYDGSSGGEDALVLGGELAAVMAARPLVSIVFRIPHHMMDRADLEAAAESEAKPLVALAKDRLSALEIETRVLTDDSPAHALDRLAESEQAGMLVLGSARHGAAGRVVLGSVGASLLYGASCAIAVAPRGFAQREGDGLRRRRRRATDSTGPQPGTGLAARGGQRPAGHRSAAGGAVVTHGPRTSAGLGTGHPGFPRARPGVSRFAASARTRPTIPARAARLKRPGRGRGQPACTARDAG